ncbi:MAG: TRAM domain-containing protein [Halobacteriaceae archaeon]
MVEIPDSLYTLFSTTLEERDGRYVVSVPADEVEHSPVAAGQTYRVALLERGTSPDATGESTTERPSSGADHPPEPPVEEGEVRTVTVEALGDKGDGIAKVERGYVVIVPGAGPGEEVEVEIESVQQNVAFAEVID